MTNVIYIAAANTDAAAATNTKTCEVPAAIRDTAQANIANIIAQDASIPPGYALFHDGIYIMPAGDETAAPILVCSPIRVDAVFANKHGKGWGKIIAVRNSDGVWQDVHVTNEELQKTPNVVLGRLIDHGLQLAHNKKAKEQIFTLLGRWKPANRMTSVNKLGWVSDDHAAFAMPDGAIGTGSVVPMIPSVGLAGGCFGNYLRQITQGNLR